MDTSSPPSASPLPDSTALLATPLAALVRHAPLMTAPDTSIREGAQAMRAAGVSSVLLVHEGQLQGIVTDRDLRNRVLAQGLSPERPLADVASAARHHLPDSASALDALTLMARHNIHHIPVLQGTQVVGVVTPSDVGLHQGPSPVQLASSIHKADSVAALAACSAQVPAMQLALARSGAGAHSVARMVTTVTDAITVRLIALAQQELGPAPVAWTWVAAGSQARMEQTARTDQDNCLLLADDYDPSAHGAYFEALTRQVCDGLDACGYVHCPGDMMAMTERWRQPLQQWRRYFRQWIDQPESMALMLCSVFFDLRAIDGDAALLEQLRQEELARAQDSKLFLGLMVRNALSQHPALGWLGGLRVIRKGQHAGCIDLKHNAIAPMVDLARIYALSGGLPAVNTRERLEQAGALDGGELSPSAARDLRDALEIVSDLRLAYQTRQIQAGKSPDNFLPVGQLSRFEKYQLKQALRIVRELQAVLKRRYQI